MEEVVILDGVAVTEEPAPMQVEATPANRESLMKLSMKALKVQCRLSNVGVTGNKDTLVNRLLDPISHRKKQAAPKTASKKRTAAQIEPSEVKHSDSCFNCGAPCGLFGADEGGVCTECATYGRSDDDELQPSHAMLDARSELELDVRWGCTEWPEQWQDGNCPGCDKRGHCEFDEACQEYACCL